jgi:uncharacterized protein YaeQ
MALSSTIYRVQLELSHVDRGVYGEHQLRLAQHPSETVERMVVRLLAFGLRHDDGLEFGRGVSATEEPDLWRREGDGRVIEWIEVGQPDAKRLIKASRKSGRCVLFAFGEGVDRWRTSQLGDLKAPENLGVARIDADFVTNVAATIERQVRWSMTVADGVIFLTSGEASFETSPEVWLGDPLG